MIYPLVREMAATGARIRVPVTVVCRVLKVSTQGYYKWRKHPVSQRDWDDAHVINVLLDAHGDDPTFGYRLLSDDLPEAGISASENRVHRLCKIASITCGHSRKRAGGAAPGPAVHDDLLAYEDEHGVTRHRFVADAPNQVWLIDISEHRTSEGKLYWCAVKDCFSNKIVGYSIDSRMKADLAASAIRNAIMLRNPVGTIVHSDRGSQFRSKKVTRLIAGNGLRGSMGRVAAAGDNAAMESFFALLQKNVLDRQRWETREELRLAIVTWIEKTYHRKRRQRALGRRTPITFKTMYQAAQAA